LNANQVLKVIGTPIDAEMANDQVIVDFNDFGQSLITYDKITGNLKIDSAVTDGIYTISIVLTDISPSGSLSTSYNIVLNVSHEVALPT
jgi:hypothetical protein